MRYITIVCKLLLGAIALMLLSSCRLHDHDDGESQTDRYRAAVKRVLEQYHAPGAVAGVWVPGSKPWKMAFGLADVATGRPLTLDDHFSIRSITKSFTVTVILQLAHDGMLSLDDHIDRYVPGIPNGSKITLMQLAAMESGVKNYTEVEAFLDALRADLGRPFTDPEIVAYAVSESPVFDPGVQYNYSNTNTILLGMVIEKVTQTPLAEVFRTRIFDPLHLTQTSYPSTIALPDPHPLPYTIDRQTGTVELAPYLNPTGLSAAGAMVSTLDDLATWGDALVTGKLVAPDLQALRFSHSRPATDGPLYDTYGLGMGSIKGWWGHTGTALGFQAATLHHPASGVTIAVLVNSSPESSVSRDDNIAQDVFQALAEVAPVN